MNKLLCKEYHKLFTTETITIEFCSYSINETKRSTLLGPAKGVMQEKLIAVVYTLRTSVTCKTGEDRVLELKVEMGSVFVNKRKNE